MLYPISGSATSCTVLYCTEVSAIIVCYADSDCSVPQCLLVSSAGSTGPQYGWVRQDPTSAGCTADPTIEIHITLLTYALLAYRTP